VSINPWSGRSKTGWMIYKTTCRLYHPYIYGIKKNAEKQIGWFGDELHKVKIVRIKENKNDAL